MEHRIDPAVIAECTRLSFNNAGFPDVVKRLGATGVERYTADLVRLEKTYYGTAGDTIHDALPLEDPPAIAEDFSEADVRRAIAASQGQEIGYAEFLRRVMAAGTASYTVFLNGRRAIYFGRDGDFHVERFPGEP